MYVIITKISWNDVFFNNKRDSTPLKNTQCLKSVHIRSFFWSVFSRICTEYRQIRSISL